MGFSDAWCLRFKLSAGDRGLLLLDCVKKAYVLQFNVCNLTDGFV